MQPAIVPIAPTFRLKKVLMATDFSYASGTLLPFVATLAQRFRSEVIIAHVTADFGKPPEQPTFSATEIEEHAKQELAELLRAPEFDSLATHGRLRKGDPATQLIDLARLESIDLIVVGTHGRKGFKHFLLGSVAEEVFRHAACPVLTVGPRVRAVQAVQDPKHILVPTDLSRESLLAMPVACAIAAEFSGRVHVLHVLPKETAANPETRELAAPLLERMKEVTQGQLSPRCAPEFLVESGPEAETIGIVAKEKSANLIVLGLRRGSSAAALHSTIAYTTIAEASCPVLTVRSMT